MPLSVTNILTPAGDYSYSVPNDQVTINEADLYQVVLNIEVDVAAGTGTQFALVEIAAELNGVAGTPTSFQVDRDGGIGRASVAIPTNFAAADLLALVARVASGTLASTAEDGQIYLLRLSQ